MNYIINDEMMKAFKNSLQLNKKYINEKIWFNKECPTDESNELIKKHQEAIKNIDIVLEELERIEKEEIVNG